MRGCRRPTASSNGQYRECSHEYARAGGANARLGGLRQSLPTGRSPQAAALWATVQLDNGSVSASGDIWFHAVSERERFLEPRGRAQIAVGDGCDRGFAGYAVAQYSAARAPLSAVPVDICRRYTARTMRFSEAWRVRLASHPHPLRSGSTTRRAAPRPSRLRPNRRSPRPPRAVSPAPRRPA